MMLTDICDGGVHVALKMSTLIQRQHELSYRSQSFNAYMYIFCLIISKVSKTASEHRMLLKCAMFANPINPCWSRYFAIDHLNPCQ